MGRIKGKPNRVKLDPSHAAAVGARLRGLRLAKGWSLRDAGAALGTTDVTVGCAERGSHAPGLALLVALARVYGVTLDYIAFGEVSSDGQGPEEFPDQPAPP